MPQLVLIKIYSLYSKIPPSQAHISMLFLRIDRKSVIATTGLKENNSCLPVERLFPTAAGNTMSKENRKRIILFRCITDNFTRAECFGYDHTFDHCSTCLSGGRCVRGNRLRHKDYECFCPSCYSGEICQFNTDRFLHLPYRFADYSR